MSSDRREQALSVFLSTIMVLSVVAIGAAGFAGSAAAQSPSEVSESGVSGGNATALATPAGTGDNAEHIYQIEVTDALLGDTDNLDQIQITYASNVFTDIDFDDTLGNDVDVYVDDSQVGTSTLSVSQSGDNQLTISGLDNAINAGQVITVEVTADSDGTELQNPSSSEDVDISLDAGAETQSETMRLRLDDEAPFIVDENDGGPEYYSVLEQAVSNAGSTVEVTGNVSNVDYADGLSDAPDIDATASTSTQGLEITGSGNPVVSTSAQGALGLNADDITVDGVYFEVEDPNRDRSSGSNTVTIDGSNVTIQNGGIEDTDTSHTDRLIFAQDGNDNVTIDNNVLNSTQASLGDEVMIWTEQVDSEITNNHFIDNEQEGFSSGTWAIQAGDSNEDAEGTNIDGNNIDTYSGVYVASPNISVTSNTVNVTGGYGVTSSDSSNNELDNGEIRDNQITGVVSAAGEGIRLFGGDNWTVENNVIDSSGGDHFTQGILVDADQGGSSTGELGNVTLTGNEIYNVSGQAVDVADSTDADWDASGGALTLDVSDLTVDDSGSATGVRVDIGATGENAPTVDVSGSSINDTSTGVQVTDTGDGQYFNVTDTTVDNSGSQAINLNDPDADVNVDGVSIDQASTGIDVDLTTGDHSADIQGTTINGTTSAGVNVAGSNLDGSDQLNITDSTLTQNNIGVDFADDAVAGDNVQVFAHFNTFDQNTKGVEVGDLDVDDDAHTDVVLNFTFNDFTNSEDYGLDVAGQSGGDTINANYSWWGDATGPDGNDQVSGAYGNGDAVTLSSDSDASVYPFLTESTDSLISSAQKSGSQLITLPDPEQPVGSSSADNTAVVGVTNLNASVGANSPDVFAPGADSVSAVSTSGTLSPSNIATFQVNDTDVGSISVQGVADGADSHSVQQSYTGQAADITFSTNASGVTADQAVQITAQAVDANENNVERQGLNVRFAEDSGFSAAGVEFTDRETNTTNAGTATAVVSSTGSLTPGEEFSVVANIDGNVVNQTFTTAAGSIDETSSELYLNGNDQSTSDLGSAVQVNTTHDIAVKLVDSTGNALADQSVEFSSNLTGVTFATDPQTTGSDGFANTTLTLPENAIGTAAINVSAGNFSADQTGRAQLNVTTEAANATTLGFTTDQRSVSPTGQIDVEVQVEDEFGNYNGSAGVNNGITVTSSDTSVISVSGVDDLSNNNETFTLTGESAGTATINITSDDADISSVEETFNVVDPNEGGLELTVAHNVATSGTSGAANQANLTAQFVDADGTAIGVSNQNITFAKQSGSAAELNQSDTFTKSTDSNGNVTIKVNGTSTTGDTSFIALAENYSVQGSVTVTTTGAANSISVSPETSSVGANETANVTVEFVDDAGRNVPKPGTSIQLSTDNGAIDDSPQSTAVGSDGQVTATLTYNASSANAGTANLTAVGGGVSGTASVTVSGQADTGSPLGGTAGEYDGDGDGQVTASELGNAVTAFGEGDLTASELGDVVTAFGQS